MHGHEYDTGDPHIQVQQETILIKCYSEYQIRLPGSEIVMVDLAFWDDSFKQDRSRDDFGTDISGIWGTHQKFIGTRMPVLLVVPRVDSKLTPV